MNTDQLECAVRTDNRLNAVVRGVYSSDNLPQYVHRYPSAFISNTDPSDLRGEHWVMFWFHSPSYGEFWDSLGHKADHYSEHFDTFIKNNVITCKYNTHALQHKAFSTCGFHVLFYLLMKCNKMRMSQIIDFAKSTYNFDHYVYEYVTGHFECI